MKRLLSLHNGGRPARLGGARLLRTRGWGSGLEGGRAQSMEESATAGRLKGFLPKVRCLGLNCVSPTEIRLCVPVWGRRSCLRLCERIGMGHAAPWDALRVVGDVEGSMPHKKGQKEGR